MKTLLYLFLFSALCCGCGSTKYSIATPGNPEAKYILVEVQDSSLLVIPEEFSLELTPEVIREYGRKIPFDSLTILTKKSSSGVALGMLAGMALGGLGGYQAYTSQSTMFGNRAQSAMLGTFIGMVPGAVFGAAANNSTKMLPVRSHLNELKQDVKHIYETRVMN